MRDTVLCFMQGGDTLEMLCCDRGCRNWTVPSLGRTWACPRDDKPSPLVGSCSSRMVKLRFGGRGLEKSEPHFFDFSGYNEPFGDVHQSQRCKYLLY